MSKIGIFYGSTTGVTEEVAGKISSKLDNSSVHNISGNFDKINDYDVIIMGASTWGYGDLQDDWLDVLDKLSDLQLSGKKVAYFGTGDQESFSDTFVDGIGIIHEKVKDTGATLIGETSIEGYTFDESKGVENDQFLGLAIDEVNQSDLTDERVEKWTEEIKKAL
jgi:flavodoxin I